jgi:hypothetical protein
MAERTDLAADVAALGKVLELLGKLPPDSQQWVISTAAGRLNLVAPSSTEPRDVDAATRMVSGASNSIKGLSAKEFLRQKAPKSDVDRVACLAYYLAYERNVSAYTSRELTAANTEAAGPKINMSRAVDNATKQSGYLTGAGKGKKQITTYGEDVVKALPNYDAAKAVAKAKVRKKKSK